MANVLIAAIVFLAVLVLWWYWHKRRFSTPPKVRLAGYLKQGRDYRIFIGYPPRSPQEWSEVADFRGDILVTREQEKLLVSDVSSFIVAYSSGEILDSERMFEPQPEGIFYIARKIEETQDVLRGEELEAGKASVEIRFGICSSRPREPYYYSTTLKNISQSKLRIVKFGGYSKDGNEWILNTITRGFFTGEQFKQWYGVDNDGWIKPGQEVTDPNNYGGPTGLWTYYCVTDTDEQFITGGIVDWFGVQKDKERA